MATDEAAIPDRHRGPWAALDLHFTLRTDVVPLAEFLDEVVQSYPAATKTGPVARFALVHRPNPDGRGRRFEVRRGSRTVAVRHQRARALEVLFGVLDDATVRASRRHVLVHGAMVAHAGNAVVIVGRSGSGKSTLALLAHLDGADYFTDEIVAIDPATGALRGARRPVQIKRAGVPFLADVLPDVPASAAPFTHLVMPVPPRAPASAAPLMPDRVAVVFASYASDHRGVELVPVRRVEAVERLMQQCWNLDLHGRVGFVSLAALVRRSTHVAALEFSDGRGAAREIGELLNGR